MNVRLLMASELIVLLALTSGALQAQTPALPVDSMALPGDFVDATQDVQLHVPMGPPSGAPHLDVTPGPSFELAAAAARTALDVCAADGYKVAVAVTDTAGHLKVALVADGALPNRVYMALRKDLTVTVFHISTITLREKINADPRLLLQVKPNMALLPGGLPILAGDRFVGAIAVSGAFAYEEEKCGNAGIAKIQSGLK